MRYLIFLAVLIIFSLNIEGKNINNFVYQLQNVNLNSLSKIPVDAVIMDYSKDGGHNQRYKKSEIKILQESGKMVLCYFSIGEAEDYRFYFNDQWKIKKPIWLGEENPLWPGNYPVKYWDKQWKNILLYNKNNYLDHIISAGFDGIYLDLVDCFYYWENKGYKNARKEMESFVIEICKQARNKSGNNEFKVFIQNAEVLVNNPLLLNEISGIGRESLWYEYNRKRTIKELVPILLDLRKALRNNKTVLVIEYGDIANKELVFFKSRLYGFIPFFARRKLDTEGIW